jgi:hypothetical protein
LDLTKKTTSWHWGNDQQKAFDELKTRMCNRPILTNPDLSKTFYLQTDASSTGAGAVLTQEVEGSKKRKPVAYFSCTFSPVEANYDIYEKEFLAVIKAIENWRAHLIWTEKPFIIETDHKNLMYWKEPKKLTERTARWHEKLQDYNFKIVHIAGKSNGPVDVLSRMHQKEEDEMTKLTPLISPDAFLNIFEAGNPGTVEHEIMEAQRQHYSTMGRWEKTLSIERNEEPGRTTWRDKEGRLIVPPDNTLKRRILREYHDHWGAGHPGHDETIRKVQNNYFWPLQRVWIDQYVKGCATCQQNKNLTHVTKTPLYKITVPENAPPFTQIAMDLITGLPLSWGYDAILTIVDHGCSRGAIFLPCKTTITRPQIAQLYYEHIYPWFRLPTKVISNRDPCFTSHFGHALAKELGITWNMSMAYRPQTDGLTERKNQWLEQYLRLVAGNDKEWSTFLAMATLVHNNAANAMTGLAPSQLLIGRELPPTPAQGEGSDNPLAEHRVRKLIKRRIMATQALNRVAQKHSPDTPHWTKGQKVWLNAKHLTLPYGSIKLVPRRHGPFVIEEVRSPVVYRLRLPPQWNIHPIFHTSLLTPYVETMKHSKNYSRPPPDMIEGEEQYEVKAIRSHQCNRRKLQYLIKWKGYPESDNTWEPVDNVQAPLLIRKYHETHPLEDKRPAKQARIASSLPTSYSPQPTWLLADDHQSTSGKGNEVTAAAAPTPAATATTAPKPQLLTPG